MKVFTMHEGWDADKEKQKRSTLVGKTMLAGMENSTKFHEKEKLASGRNIMQMKCWSISKSMQRV